MICRVRARQRRQYLCIGAHKALASWASLVAQDGGVSRLARVGVALAVDDGGERGSDQAHEREKDGVVQRGFVVRQVHHWQEKDSWRQDPYPVKAVMRGVPRGGHERGHR